MKQTPPIVDPQAVREQQNYENPIASRELISEILAAAEGPLSHMTLCQRLGLDDPNAIEALRRRLIAMERDGQLVSNRKGAYAVADKFDLVRGRVQGHRDGYGFVIPQGGGEDIYLTNRQMRKVFDGDEVLVRKGQTDFRGRIEGAIIEVISTAAKTIVGRLYNERGIHFLRADNPRIFQDILVADDALAGAKAGQLITLEVIDHPFKNRFPAGRVLEVLGEHLAPGVEIDVSIRSHNIPYIWPDEVTAEAAKISPQVQEADKAARIDLRHLPLVTIDGEDARDFDDAVFCESKRGGGWRLYVAIADVAHYVAVGSALDQEAQIRGNSVYFPDYVVPMLPEALSNGLCSLNPAVDRLCMVCEMTISAAGKITGYVFYEAVMHSKARFTYTQVGQILGERGENNSELRQHYATLVPHLDELANLYKVLRAARDVRGAIDFETTETRIVFDAQRKIEKIIPVVRNDAHKLIEECMLAANVCAAKFLEELGVPALYRVHEPPKERKLELLRDFLSELGLALRNYDDIKPADYQDIIHAIAHRADASLIQTVLLRSMNQAVYRPENKGHFGLAYQAYTHFTSPIRRYPDLLTHRAIRSLLRADKPSKRVRRHPDALLQPASVTYPYAMADIVNMGEQCSLSERRADEATRDVVSWLKCEYLQSRVGEVFPGIIGAVVGFGLFVELTELFVEGLVHISSLPQDYYHHQPAQHRLVGERSGRVFRLGDRLTVKVVRVNLDDRKIDFELVNHLGNSVPDIRPFKLGKVAKAKQQVNERATKANQIKQAERLALSGGKKNKHKNNNKKLSKSARQDLREANNAAQAGRAKFTQPLNNKSMPSQLPPEVKTSKHDAQPQISKRKVSAAPLQTTKAAGSSAAKKTKSKANVLAASSAAKDIFAGQNKTAKKPSADKSGAKNAAQVKSSRVTSPAATAQKAKKGLGVAPKGNVAGKQTSPAADKKTAKQTATTKQTVQQKAPANKSTKSFEVKSAQKSDVSKVGVVKPSKTSSAKNAPAKTASTVKPSTPKTPSEKKVKVAPAAKKATAASQASPKSRSTQSAAAKSGQLDSKKAVKTSMAKTAVKVEKPAVKATKKPAKKPARPATKK